MFSSIRFFFPRRKWNLLNLILLFILIFFYTFIVLREKMTRIVSLPPGESQTWLPEIIKMHTIPDPSAKRTGNVVFFYLM